MKDTSDEQIEEATINYVAQKCPVCNGWGTVSFKRIICHACEGKGYLLIPKKTDGEKYDYER